MDLSGVPTNHPLTGCFAKYQRAQEHFDSLNAKVLDRYGEGGHPTFLISRGIDPDNSDVFRWIVESVDEPPLEWATIVGDVVHNLRSSLDHLVYELSFLGTRGSPGSRTSFPCSLTRANWCSSDTQCVKLKGVLERHKHRLYRINRATADEIMQSQPRLTFVFATRSGFCMIFGTTTNIECYSRLPLA
jgi:hypothetical protein